MKKFVQKYITIFSTRFIFNYWIYKIPIHRLYRHIRNRLNLNRKSNKRDEEHIQLYNDGRISKMVLADRIGVNIGTLDWWLTRNGYNETLSGTWTKRIELC